MSPESEIRGKQKKDHPIRAAFLGKNNDDQETLVLCRLSLLFFFLLCVAIFLSLRFLPQGTTVLLGYV
jgi:hypothetical protein